METQELINAFAKALGETGALEKHTAMPGTANSSILLQQPGGLFTVAGADQTVISTHITPMGLASVLPIFPSNTDDPRYSILTGFSDDYGSEPVGPCDDAPVGYIKAGTLTGAFGHVMRQTNTIVINEVLHEQRGATTNLSLMGQMLGEHPMKPNMSTQDMLDVVTKAEMVSVGVRMERVLATMTWQGTPSANTAGGGYKEFPGLDQQIATGQVDAETNTTMPAVDSTIMDFAYDAVGGSGRDIVEYVSMMEYYLSDVASRTGLDPVTWAICMRPNLFFELTTVWACRYLSDRCTDSDGNNITTINDHTAVRMRDEMRNGRYLIVNGKTIPVIVDDGIFEHNNINNANLAAAEYASSIYFVPLRIRGTFPVTYWEYVDYRGISRHLSAMGEGGRRVPFWTDGGRFLWVYRDNGYCFDLQTKVEPRVILRTPQLAGRIQHVQYTPLLHTREFDPASPYWVDGGVSTRAITTGNAVWA